MVEIATDATGTPTALGIPKYNTAIDAPSGKGFNAAMDSLETLLRSRAGNLALTDAGATITLGGDSTLSRISANALKSSGSLSATGDIFSSQGLANQIALSTDGRLYFSNLVDTYLYRDSAANLKTDGTFRAASSIVVDTANAGGKIYWGSALDANIWRVSAGLLRTDTVFDATGGLRINNVPVGVVASYTPTWTSTGTAPSFGNATVTGTYLQVGKFVSVEVTITFGTTSTYGTGSYNFSLPVGALNLMYGTGTIWNSGGSNANTVIWRTDGSLYKNQLALATVLQGDPITLATGSQLILSLNYLAS